MSIAARCHSLIAVSSHAQTKLAEARWNRTILELREPDTGFEDQEHHQAPCASLFQSAVARWNAGRASSRARYAERLGKLASSTPSSLAASNVKPSMTSAAENSSPSR